MALLDKLGELAKNVGDKTNELIETGRLSSRAKSEENAIDALKKELGQYIYSQYLEGRQYDETVMEQCRNIQAAEEAVAELYAEIQKRKEESAKAVSETTAACQNCGAEVPKNAQFCSSCGAKIEAQEKEFCAQCGAELAPDARFCGSCGAKIQED